MLFLHMHFQLKFLWHHALHLSNLCSLSEMSQFSWPDNVWNMFSPSKEIVLLRPDQSTSSHEVRCMSVVGHKVWVGCGPYIHLLDVEDLINEVICRNGLFALW